MTRYQPLVLIVLAASASFACNREKTDTTQTTGATIAVEPTVTQLNASQSESQNALSQSNDPSDLATTAAIREALMADVDLSTSAKNITVITTGGTITLRGTVNTDAEKRDIDEKALAAAGSNLVDDRLDVVTHN
jgi:osmotically-inducible protein OsmY